MEEIYRARYGEGTQSFCALSKHPPSQYLSVLTNMEPSEPRFRIFKEVPYVDNDWLNHLPLVIKQNLQPSREVWKGWNFQTLIYGWSPWQPDSTLRAL